MGSFGSARNKLIRQFRFPFQYEDAEKLIQADHDRMFEWDYAHARATFQHHMKTGELGLPGWARRATNEQVLALLKDLFKVDEDCPGAKWTGYRITGTVNRSNGYPVYSLWLFAKRRGSKTKVYSGDRAPNTTCGLPGKHMLGDGPFCVEFGEYEEDKDKGLVERAKEKFWNTVNPL